MDNFIGKVCPDRRTFLRTCLETVKTKNIKCLGEKSRRTSIGKSTSHGYQNNRKMLKFSIPVVHLKKSSNKGVYYRVQNRQFSRFSDFVLRLIAKIAKKPQILKWKKSAQNFFCILMNFLSLKKKILNFSEPLVHLE